ncbi:two-component system response regulator [cf. Phormidesmis sp. LEGE 11477]|uniref:response regulator n=1 Tax=cf. Phormidesmis sp. LEGE 11477 TaxID=1828680 RepID=UPI00187ED9D2|nr:response regulator [cf. Phormidesmis sp. LEGE 11477]MBE9059553.1 response regulator [cf. Phormidesmis sp. LEGE 11477]
MENLILCVGRNCRNQELLSQVLEKAGYSVRTALNCETLTQMVDQSSISLVLLDVAGFDRQIWQHCRMLKSHRIPYFLITPSGGAHLSASYRQQYFNAQEDDTPLLVKPLSIRLLLALISYTL